MAKSPKQPKRINFKAVNEAALSKIKTLVTQWLPSGQFDGPEYVALNPNRADRKLGSFRINCITGKWSEFALDGVHGTDVVSYYAYIFNLSQGEAGKELASLLGFSDEAVEQRYIEQAAAAPSEEKKKRSLWRPILPVPKDAPRSPLADFVRGLAEQIWQYKNQEGQLLGVVMKFTTSEGAKDLIPYTFCEHQATKKREWRAIAFPEPRPLYGLERLALKPKAKVLIVEGEKCADAGHEFLTDYVVLSWPGGGKVTHKADWSVLAGREVIIWPDADSQRLKAPKEDPQRLMPFKPFNKQPGLVAALKINEILQKYGIKPALMKLPRLGRLPDGWDIYDAIHKDKWTVDQVKKYIDDRINEKEEAPDVAPHEVQEAISEDWKKGLYRDEDGRLKPARENIYLILSRHPDWKGVIAFNEFTNEVLKLKAPPFLNGCVGPWSEEDNSRLGLWLAETKGVRMLIRSLTTLQEAVNLVAHNNAIHPVKDYLDSLTWDGQDRIDHFFIDFFGTKDSPYERLAARFFFLSLVYRIYEPGCKQDYMIILEGLQGESKSSALEALAAPWFSDTALDLSSKEAYIGIQGVWLQEIGELDSFNKSEINTIKRFTTSKTDKYRAPYDKITKKHPRQTVFAGTTNEDEYLRDPTGNRRFWPLLVLLVNLQGIIANRDQLFAEAVARYKKQERYYPTKEEEEKYFVPEQVEREINDPWYYIIKNWVSKETTPKYTIADILINCLRYSASQITAGGSESKRIGGIMRKLGWTVSRETRGKRDRYFVRPKDQFPKVTTPQPEAETETF